MTKPIITLASGRKIGPGQPAYIIAEIGSNHDGSLDKAKQLVHAAKQAGADAVKFQSFQVEALINPTRQSDAGMWEPHSAWDILDKLTLPAEWHAELQKEAQQAGIDFLSAPFDADRLALLASLDVSMIKIASGDLTHHTLLQKAAATGLPVLLSTGVAYLGEVEAALKILNDAGCNQVALLHCVSLYPPSFADANIRAMVTMHQAFQVPVGFSDHTPGSVVPMGAIALGASVIEKHMTDDKSLPGPDHPYALDIPEFTEMVTQIRQLESALGSGIKAPTAGEIGERIGARRAVYAKADIPSGTLLTENLLSVVRHAYPQGIPAHEAATLIGKRTRKALQAHDIICWQHIE